MVLYKCGNDVTAAFALFFNLNKLIGMNLLDVLSTNPTIIMILALIAIGLVWAKEGENE